MGGRLRSSYPLKSATTDPVCIAGGTKRVGTGVQL
jgi:hypothetical protein